jgi:homoserine dehydrogenase
MTRRRHWRIGFVGFGNVNRALARLLVDRRRELEERHGLTFEVTLLCSARRGALTDPDGIDLEQVLLKDWRGAGPTLEAIEHASLDLLFEGTPLDPERGEPATSHVRAALHRGMSVVSANKGPIAFAARELFDLARRGGVGLRFESAVADCMPVFNLIEAAVPVGRIEAFRGVLNSTSNEVLQAVIRGERLESAVEEMQRRGIAEADPRHDLDGWDHATKAVILSNVLFGRDLRPQDVERVPLSKIDGGWLRAEIAAGRTIRLVASGSGHGVVRVEPLALEPGEFLASLTGGSLGLVLETELAGTIHVASVQPGVKETAYGMLADLVAIHQGRLLAAFPLLQGPGRRGG